MPILAICRQCDTLCWYAVNKNMLPVCEITKICDTRPGTTPDISLQFKCFPARGFFERLLGVTNGAVRSSLQLE